ncbi:hypothetical protein DJ013_04755 [Arcticibacterium luteifluviistationis]|uniref:Uncharacterized protein n=2 Tax=Arcticibacterium luteifluviistationis TaxID=1784714 RepID=A0A2Z4G8H9_9BACT|nr:hypothetical protein DJ013_04755 [Arcticibacterium luteifluviistationis]
MFFLSPAYSQEYINLEKIGDLLSDELNSEFADMDSLEMTIYVRFKVNQSGKLDSIWVNGEEPESFDYDYFIETSETKLTSIFYSFLKKDYLIRKAIFKVLRNVKVSHSNEEYYSGYYLLPIRINLKGGLSDFYYENHFRAMKSFFKPGFQQYYFLEPIAISRMIGKVKPKKRKK